MNTTKRNFAEHLKNWYFYEDRNPESRSTVYWYFIRCSIALLIRNKCQNMSMCQNATICVGKIISKKFPIPFHQLILPIQWPRSEPAAWFFRSHTVFPSALSLCLRSTAPLQKPQGLGLGSDNCIVGTGVWTLKYAILAPCAVGPLPTHAICTCISVIERFEKLSAFFTAQTSPTQSGKFVRRWNVISIKYLI